MRGDPEFRATIENLTTLQVDCGLHTDREKMLLWSLSKQTQEGAIVEIGSFEGYSTILLAKAARSYSTVYAIDPHVGKLILSDEEESPHRGNTWQRFSRNVNQAGVTEKIQALKVKTEQAVLGWQKPVGLLFIDGSHRYEDVKKDLLFWRSHLLPGSKVVFHDIWVVGVRKVIDEHILRDRSFGSFVYAPCCMFAATYFGNTYHRQFLRRRFWRLLLSLRGVIERRRTLRRWLHGVMRILS